MRMYASPVLPRHLLGCAVLAVLLSSFFAPAAQAQVLYGSIVGQWEIKTGAGQSRETATEPAGRDNLPNVLPGGGESGRIAAAGLGIAAPGKLIHVHGGRLPAAAPDAARAHAQLAPARQLHQQAAILVRLLRPEPPPQFCRASPHGLFRRCRVDTTAAVTSAPAWRARQTTRPRSPGAFPQPARSPT